MFALVVAAVLVVLVVFFHISDTILRYWYVVIPLGVLLWFWLLAFEFGPRHNEAVREELNALAKRLPFSIRKRRRPNWAQPWKRNSQ